MLRNVALLFLAVTVLGAEIPPVPSADGLDVFPAWRAVTDDASARNAIVSFAEPPSCIATGAVRLDAGLPKLPDAARANWDIRVPCDLRNASGVQFDFYCSNLAPFSGFSFYFKSGDGWYAATFSPRRSGRWERITVFKNATTSEGQASGWASVSVFRVSGWLVDGDRPNVTCALANFAPVGGVPEIAVVRADSQLATAGTEANGISHYAATVSATLERLGVPSVQMADTDLRDAGMLGRVKLVILPYNHNLPEEAVTVLREFVGRGGKLMAFYVLSEPVAAMLGLRVTELFRLPNGHRFAGFAKHGRGLAGQPDFAVQGSWIAHSVEPRDGIETEVLANWRDDGGNDTGRPAIVKTPAGFFVGHVWLGGNDNGSDRLMQALVGSCIETVWKDCAVSAYGRIGKTAASYDLAELRSQLPDRLSGPIAELWSRGEALRASAKADLDAGRWIEATDKSNESAKLFVQAWLRDFPARPDEHRAFWCHSAWGLGGGRDWDASVKFLKENGFNAILPNLAWGATAFYPSKVLEEDKSVADGRDALAECIAACHKYGVKLHIWKVCYNLGGYASADLVERLRAAGRLQRGFDADGKNRARWLCPSHPENQRQEIEAMVELAQRPVDGIHFDYIRYPDENTCFCDGCRARFEQRLGRKLDNWPKVVRQDQETAKAWHKFRQDQISLVVRGVAERVRKLPRRVEISAAVFRNAKSDPVTVGQDWRLWCEQGWLDFVCPMDYVDSPEVFRSMVASQGKACGKARLYPGIGMSCWKDPCDPMNLAMQIKMIRAEGYGGFTVFNFDRYAERVLPELGLREK